MIQLPDGDWRNLCDGRGVHGTVGLQHLLDAFPVALLTRAA